MELRAFLIGTLLLSTPFIASCQTTAQLEGFAKPTLPVQILGKLDLAVPVSPGRPAFLASASGLVKRGDRLFVVADDEIHLGIFSASLQNPGEKYALFPNANVPKDEKTRRQVKPDLEGLAFFPAKYFPPYGALLALPSGSTAMRMIGALIILGADSLPIDPVRLIDFTPLYRQLRETFLDLNLEGIAFVNSHVHLYQRGNGATKANGWVELDLKKFVRGLKKGVVDDKILLKTQRVAIGSIDNVDLTFTDAVAFKDGVLFLAAAEKTESTYSDGVYVGAAIGYMDAKGRTLCVRRIKAPVKPEGLALDKEGTRDRLLMVTDGDDPSRAALLLALDFDLNRDC